MTTRRVLGQCRLCGEPVYALGPATGQVRALTGDPDQPVELEWVEHPGCRDERWGDLLDELEEALA